MSETYTAVYERDGAAWVVEVAEEPRIHLQAASLPEARKHVRDALAEWLETDSEQLHIVDDFRLPTKVRAARESVQATRTDDDRAQIMANMTDSRSAREWAEELGIADRDPTTVEWLANLLGDQQVSIDTFCHKITMAEEFKRLTAAEESQSVDSVRDKE